MQEVNCSNSNEQFNRNPLQMILCLGMVFSKNFLGNDVGQCDRDRTRCLGMLLFLLTSIFTINSFAF